MSVATRIIAAGLILALGSGATPGSRAERGASADAMQDVQPTAEPTTQGTDCVILLHGLARSAFSMRPLQNALMSSGYYVVNDGYPSRDATVEVLAPEAIGAARARCALQQAPRVHFVTHSMGGILVRYYLRHHNMPNLGRVVMLAPPNRGSEIVDNLSDAPGFLWLNGPAGAQLGTGPASLPAQLGPVDYPVGVIAGTLTINPILSQYLPNPDDGKVSVARTRVEGMADFITLPTSHPLILSDDDAIRQTLAFLAQGHFDDGGDT